jgi:hypothetical protein
MNIKIKNKRNDGVVHIRDKDEKKILKHHPNATMQNKYFPKKNS